MINSSLSIERRIVRAQLYLPMKNSTLLPTFQTELPN
jgi:hypothetical protein